MIKQAGYSDGLQLCLTFWEGLHPSLMDYIDNMAEGHPDDEHVDTWYKVAREQWQLMELKHECMQHPPVTFCSLTAPRVGVNPSIPSHVALFHALPAAPPCPLPQGVPIDVDASHQQSSTLLLCQHCGKAGHFARYCPQRLEVHYLSSSEQEELLAQLLAVCNAAGTPSPDALTTVSPTEVVSKLEVTLMSPSYH
ncbi:hypothetical protein C0989_010003 [Termitomyces sp. Mn162]|nr:hypothetical protein C0989_010003 [Termitomyces sp. Mn162]